MGSKERGERRAVPVLLASALCALAGSAAGSSPSFDAAGWRTRLLAHGFSRAQTDSAVLALERAGSRQLPVSVLENRLREGLARRATPATILHVLGDRQADLVRADDVARRGSSQGVGPRDRTSSLVRLADAFSMGVPPADAQTLVPAAARAGRSLDDVSRSAEVMGRLARLGFRPPDTREVLQAALVQGWARPRLDGLVGVFVAARGRGLAPGQVRELLVAGIQARKEPGDLSQDVEAAEAAKATSGAAGGGAGAAKAGASGEQGGSAHGNQAGGRGAQHAPASGAHGQAPHTPAPRTPAPRAPAPHGPRAPMPRPPMPHH